MPAKKVLLVSTSASSMGGNPTGLWLAELAEPYYILKEAGLEVTLASIAGGAVPIDAGSCKGDFFTVEAKRFMHDADAIGALGHTPKLVASMADDFDCLYLAGGHGCCVDFVGEPGAELKACVEKMYAAGKVVCAFTNTEEAQAGATDWVKANSVFMEDEFKAKGGAFKEADPWTSNVCVAGNLMRPRTPRARRRAQAVAAMNF
ncbi:glyoxalase [Aureococcus anophagefferens]|nr:glyoxalase [Aureococcus anophagefferens]